MDKTSFIERKSTTMLLIGIILSCFGDMDSFTTIHVFALISFVGAFIFYLFEEKRENRKDKDKIKEPKIKSN